MYKRSEIQRYREEERWRAPALLLIYWLMTCVRTLVRKSLLPAHQKQFDISYSDILSGALQRRSSQGPFKRKSSQGSLTGILSGAPHSDLFRGPSKRSSQGSFKGIFSGAPHRDPHRSSHRNPLRGPSQGSSQGPLTGSYQGSTKGSSQGPLTGILSWALQRELFKGFSQGSSQSPLTRNTLRGQ